MSNNSSPSNSKSEDSPLGQVTSLDVILLDIEWKATFESMTTADRTKLKQRVLDWHKTEVVKMAKEHIHDCLIEYAETGTVACFERAKATYESKRNEGMEALKDTKESL